MMSENFSGPMPKHTLMVPEHQPQPEPLTAQPTIQHPKEDLFVKEELRNQLVLKISGFEKDLLAKYNKLQERLAQRETELDTVKKLLVEKLKELESNFVDLGEHIANHQQTTAEE